MLVKITFWVASLAIVGAGLTGCATPAAPTTVDASNEAVDPAPEPEAPADLTGEWKQNNSESEDAYQAATISADTITIYWVSNNGDTKALYWAGTYTGPTEAGSFTWTSQNDTSQTDSAMLASSDPTKDFKFDNDEISYSASALGTTTTVRLSRK